MTLILSILLWLPLGRAVGAARRRRARRRRRRRCSARSAALGDRDRVHRRLQRPARRPAARHRRDVDLRARDPLQARRQRPEPFLVALTAFVFASRCGGEPAPWAKPTLFYFHLGSPRRPCSARSSPRTSRCSSFSSTSCSCRSTCSPASGAGPARVHATTKLVIYTLVGSLLMLAAAVATAVLSRARAASRSTSPSRRSRRRRCGSGTQDWIFLLFAAAFLVKMPAFPLHGWMPDGYREMPLPVLAVFSGVLTKVAAYGFLRDLLPLLPRRQRALPDADAADRRWPRSSTARRWPSRRPTPA